MDKGFLRTGGRLDRERRVPRDIETAGGPIQDLRCNNAKRYFRL